MCGADTQLAFYVNLHRAVIGPSATLTGRWRPDIDLRRMLTGYLVLTFTFTILWVDSADDKWIFVFLSYPKIAFDISCKLGDKLHEMSKLICLEQIRKTYFKVLSVEDFRPHAKRLH